MTHYFREAISLATQNKGKVYWASNPRNFIAHGFIFVDNNILEVRVSERSIVVALKHDVYVSRLSCVSRTDNKAEDINNAIQFAIRDN